MICSLEVLKDSELPSVHAHQHLSLDLMAGEKVHGQ